MALIVKNRRFFYLWILCFALTALLLGDAVRLGAEEVERYFPAHAYPWTGGGGDVSTSINITNIDTVSAHALDMWIITDEGTLSVLSGYSVAAGSVDVLYLDQLIGGLDPAEIIAVKVKLYSTALYLTGGLGGDGSSGVLAFFPADEGSLGRVDEQFLFPCVTRSTAASVYMYNPTDSSTSVDWELRNNSGQIEYDYTVPLSADEAEHSVLQSGGEPIEGYLVLEPSAGHTGEKYSADLFEMAEDGNIIHFRPTEAGTSAVIPYLYNVQSIEQKIVLFNPNASQITISVDCWREGSGVNLYWYVPAYSRSVLDLATSMPPGWNSFEGDGFLLLTSEDSFHATSYLIDDSPAVKAEVPAPEGGNCHLVPYGLHRPDLDLLTILGIANTTDDECEVDFVLHYYDGDLESWESVEMAPGDKPENLNPLVEETSVEYVFDPEHFGLTQQHFDEDKPFWLEVITSGETHIDIFHGQFPQGAIFLGSNASTMVGADIDLSGLDEEDEEDPGEIYTFAQSGNYTFTVDIKGADEGALRLDVPVSDAVTVQVDKGSGWETLAPGEADDIKESYSYRIQTSGTVTDRIELTLRHKSLTSVFDKIVVWVVSGSGLEIVPDFDCLFVMPRAGVDNPKTVVFGAFKNGSPVDVDWTVTNNGASPDPTDAAFKNGGGWSTTVSGKVVELSAGPNPSETLDDVTIQADDDGDTEEDVGTIVKIDMDVDGWEDDADEPKEENPGAIVVRNHDGNNAPRKKIIIKRLVPHNATVDLTLSRNSEHIDLYTTPTGEEKITFTDGKHTISCGDIPVNGMELYVEGVDASNQMRDEVLKIKVDKASDTIRFTVLWVTTITGKIANKISAKIHNAAHDEIKTRYFEDLGVWKKGEDRHGIGIEFKGTVKPSNFSNDTVLEREAAFRDYFDAANGSTYLTKQDFADDTGNPN